MKDDAVYILSALLFCQVPLPFVRLFSKPT